MERARETKRKRFSDTNVQRATKHKPNWIENDYIECKRRRKKITETLLSHFDIQFRLRWNTTIDETNIEPRKTYKRLMLHCAHVVRIPRVGVFSRGLFLSPCLLFSLSLLIHNVVPTTMTMIHQKNCLRKNETLANHTLILHVLIDTRAIVLDNNIEIWTKRNSAIFTWRLSAFTLVCDASSTALYRSFVLYIRFQFTLFHCFCLFVCLFSSLSFFISFFGCLLRSCYSKRRKICRVSVTVLHIHCVFVRLSDRGLRSHHI